MKKSLKITLTTAAVLIIVGSIYLFLRPKEKHTAEYDTIKITKGSISNTITATGTIEPIIQVEVGTQVSGIISKIYVDYNSEVKIGQVLAELDRTVLEAELNSSKANLASSKNEFEYQEKNYVRIKGLHDKGMVSDTDYESAEYQYLKAKNAYDKAQSDMVKAQTNLNYSTITSPIDGVVLSRAVDEGQTVAASFNTPTLFTIANDLRKMQVIADVDEADIGQVREGQRVTFTVDAFPDDVFEGAITQVRLEPTTTSNVVTYEVVVDAPNPDLKLKPGLTANITVFTVQENDIYVVPTKALRFKPATANTKSNQPAAPSGNSKTVWVFGAAGIAPVQVSIGITDGLNTQITKGLKEGDKVIVGMKAAQPVAGTDETPAENKETNPFMPTPPGGNKKR